MPTKKVTQADLDATIQLAKKAEGTWMIRRSTLTEGKILKPSGVSSRGRLAGRINIDEDDLKRRRFK